MSKREPDFWITRGGKHIPIFKDKLRKRTEPITHEYYYKKKTEAGKYRQKVDEHEDRVAKANYELAKSDNEKTRKEKLNADRTFKEAKQRYSKRLQELETAKQSKKINSYSFKRNIDKELQERDQQIAKNNNLAHKLNNSTPEPKFNKVPKDSSYGIDTEAIYKDEATGWTIEQKISDSFGMHRVVLYVKDKKGNQINKFTSANFANAPDAQVKMDQYAKGTLHSVQESAKQYLSDYSDVLGPKRPVVFDKLVNYMKENNTINPNYKTFGQTGEEYKKWHHNCAICSAAVVMQLKGYNVEAGPRDAGKWRGTETIFEVDYSNPDNFLLSSARNNYDNFRVTGDVLDMADREARNAINRSDFKNTLDWVDARKEYVKQYMKKYKRMPKGASAVAKAVQEKMKEWGPEAVAELSVQWEGKVSQHSVIVLYDKDIGAYIWDAQNNTIKSGANLERYFQRTTASRSQLVRLDNAKFKPFIEEDLKKMFIKRK